MKGMTGLIVAGVLGVFGVALNWFYLEQKSRSLETISLLGLKEDAVLETGDVFTERHLVPVTIPQANAKYSPDFIYLWEDRQTIIGIPATRDYAGGELVYKQDYRTPQTEIELREDERLLPITIGERSPLVEPGDEVSFWIGGGGVGSAGEIIGPFRVGAIGNQVGSRNVMRAYKVPHMSSNQLGIIVKVEGTEFEQRANSLLQRLSQADARNVKVILHPRDE